MTVVSDRPTTEIVRSISLQSQTLTAVSVKLIWKEVNDQTGGDPSVAADNGAAGDGRRQHVVSWRTWTWWWADVSRPRSRLVVDNCRVG